MELKEHDGWYFWNGNLLMVWSNKCYKRKEAFVDVHDQFQYCVHALRVIIELDVRVVVNEI